MELDRLDRRILEVLQKDGAISNLDLAERIGLSATPCARRVKQLQERGIIDKQVTLLNPAALNLKLTALIQVSMDRHTPDRFEHFEKSILACPEVQECLLITGQASDYQLKVVVQDMDSYHEFLLNKITRIEGVTGVQSSFVMRKVVDTTEYPLKHLG